MKILLLQNPGHNRVYYHSADKLALAELKIACKDLSVKIQTSKVIELEGIRYIFLESEGVLSDSDFRILSSLSFVFALFRLESKEENACLFPVRKFDYTYIDEKITSLQKYHGKTNELFTKMMINIGHMSSNFRHVWEIELLDPVAGKGTTLFEAAVYGFDSYGVEIESKSVHEAAVFFKKYLENERFKHTSNKRRIAGAGSADAVFMLEFEYAKSKKEFKTKDSTKKMGFVCGDTQDVFSYFKKERFHLLVGDLPYGIVHGNTQNKKKLSITRNPSELLAASLPEWKKVLKTGGTIVVAWNTFVVSRKKIIAIFEENGFSVCNTEPYQEFQHMVDKSIKRDIVVAKK